MILLKIDSNFKYYVVTCGFTGIHSITDSDVFVNTNRNTINAGIQKTDNTIIELNVRKPRERKGEKTVDICYKLLTVLASQYCNNDFQITLLIEGTGPIDYVCIIFTQEQCIKI